MTTASNGAGPVLLAGRPDSRVLASEQVLPSGLRVLAARRGGAPIVEIRLVVPFGGAAASHLATAELLAATLFGGCGERTREDIDAELASLGATLSTTVRPEFLQVSGCVLAAELAPLLLLLREVLTGASYPAPELATQRARLALQIRAHLARPHVAARQALLRRCFGGHPAAMEVPDERDIAQTDAGAVRLLHATGLVPGGAGLVLVGDLEPAQLLGAAAVLTDWTAQSAATRLQAPPPVPASGIELVDEPGCRKVTVGLAGAAPAQGGAGYPAAQLANLVLGGYFASRLFERLRESLGYVYVCRSQLTERAATGAMLLEFTTSTRHCSGALQETYDELRKITSACPPGSAEIGSARGFAIGSQAVALASQTGLADALATLAVRGQPVSWLERLTAALATATDDEVRDQAARLFEPASLTGFVLGPAGVLAGAPSPLGGLLPAASTQYQQEYPTNGGDDD